MYGKASIRMEAEGGEGSRRLLLVSHGWIERDEIDVAPFHNSRPIGATSSQARSSSVIGAWGSHCASSSPSVYLGFGCGWTIKRSLVMCINKGKYEDFVLVLQLVLQCASLFP